MLRSCLDESAAWRRTSHTKGSLLPNGNSILPVRTRKSSVVLFCFWGAVDENMKSRPLQQHWLAGSVLFKNPVCLIFFPVTCEALLTNCIARKFVPVACEATLESCGQYQLSPKHPHAQVCCMVWVNPIVLRSCTWK